MQDGAQGGKAATIEWIVAGVSAALVVAMIGFVLHQAIFSTNHPPDLAVTTEAVDRSLAGWRVSFRVSNRGDQAAAAVRVAGELKDGMTTLETSEASLDYVPARSERRGALLFTHDPGRHRLDLKAAGYAIP